MECVSVALMAFVILVLIDWLSQTTELCLAQMSKLWCDKFLMVTVPHKHLELSV